MKVVLVKFQDPTTHDQWVLMSGVDQSLPRLGFACGFLLEENDKVVKVALLLGQDKEIVSNWIDIPAGCVVSIHELKEVDWSNA